MVTVRDLELAERDWAAGLYQRFWGTPVVVRRGELVDLLTLPALVGELEDERAGLATYALRDDGCELASMITTVRGSGVGRALMEAVRARAVAAGAARLWLVTTNDNTPALRFYQRWGLDLVALRVGAVDDARRTIKPEIPETGRDDIPLRHELELAVGL
jgi:GNAT superfamily N-acetyltransferase